MKRFVTVSMIAGCALTLATAPPAPRGETERGALDRRRRFLDHDVVRNA